jgi:sugar phosphate isomerase/epimerase
MRLAFSTLGCPELGLAEVAETAARHDYQGVELRGQAGEHVDSGLSAAGRRAARRLFSDRGLQIVGVTAYTRFADPDRRARRENEERLLAFVDLAADLQAPFVRTFIGLWDDKGRAEAAGEAAESLNRVAERIAASPVTVLVETHDRVSRVRDLAPILRRVPSPRIGVLWDMAHSWRSGEALRDSLELIGGRLGYVHLKDGRLGPSGELCYCLPGDGELPLLECRDLLAERGLRSWLCLEWERKWHPELPPLEAALGRFRTLMESGQDLRSSTE